MRLLTLGTLCFTGFAVLVIYYKSLMRRVRRWDPTYFRSGFPVFLKTVRAEMGISFVADPKRIESAALADWMRMKMKNPDVKLRFGRSGDDSCILFGKSDAIMPLAHGNLVIDPLAGRLEIIVRLNGVILGLILALATVFLLATVRMTLSSLAMGCFFLVVSLFFLAYWYADYSEMKENAMRVANLMARENGLGFGSLGSTPRLDKLMEAISRREKSVRKMTAEIGFSALNDNEPSVRKAAAHILGVVGDNRAVEPLIDRLKNASEDEMGETVAVAEALGLIGGEKAVRALAEMMEHRSLGFRKAAAAALEATGKEGVDPFVKALTSDTVYIRETAARALGKIGHEKATAPLISALADPARKVREAAALSLGRIRDRRAITSLINVVSNPDSRANRMAAMALAELGDARSLAHLIAMMKEDAFVSEEPEAALNNLVQSNKPFLDTRPSDLFCYVCLRRGAEKQKFRIPRHIPLSRMHLRTGRIVFCGKCHGALSFYARIRQVVGIVGGNFDGVEIKEDIVSVSLWNQEKNTARYAQIDSLTICDHGVENYDFAINAVILELTADATVSNDWIKKIPVRFEGDPPLSNSAMNMLRDNFSLKDA